jgi:hypothetical protein
VNALNNLQNCQICQSLGNLNNQVNKEIASACVKPKFDYGRVMLIKSKVKKFELSGGSCYDKVQQQYRSWAIFSLFPNILIIQRSPASLFIP